MVNNYQNIRKIILIQIPTRTVWTSNVVPAEIVRRPPGDPPRGVSGGSPDILAKITGKSRENFQKKFFFAFFMTILSGFASDLAKKSGDPLWGVSRGSLDDFRWDNIACPHGKQ